MEASLEDKVDTVEPRTESLEAILARFISSTNKMLIRLENDTKKFIEENRADRKKYTEGKRADTEKLRDEIKDSKDETKDSKDETKDSKDETKDFKDEMKEFKDEMRLSRKKMNEKWEALCIKMGTLVEDMVAPSIPGIAREYFGDDEFNFFGLHVLKRNVKDRSRRREFDIIAASEKNFYINETKSKPAPEDPNAFSEMLKDILDYFPENRGKKLVPIFSALYLPEEIIKNLTRRGIFAMGSKEGTMDLLNFDQASKRG